MTWDFQKRRCVKALSQTNLSGGDYSVSRCLCLSLPGLCNMYPCRNWETPQQLDFQREYSSTLWKSSPQKLKYPKWLATCISWPQCLSHVIKIMTTQKEKSGKTFSIRQILSYNILITLQADFRPGTDEIVERTSHQFCQLLLCRPWGSCDFFLTRTSVFSLSDCLFFSRFHRP